ncbi:MAG: hypothetical protein IJH99_03360 [Eubacterium sp.]|nr:hypothetical protein [Eubacterium sp.]
MAVLAARAAVLCTKGLIEPRKRSGIKMISVGDMYEAKDKFIGFHGTGCPDAAAFCRSYKNLAGTEKMSFLFTESQHKND